MIVRMAIVVIALGMLLAGTAGRLRRLDRLDRGLLTDAVLFLVAIGRRFGVAIGRDRGLAIRDRDAVIVRVDLVEGQEAVAVAAILDKGGLERGLHPRHLGQIDVTLDLLLG